MSDSRPAAVYRAALTNAALEVATVDDAELDAFLSGALERARSTFPSVTLADEPFVRHLARHHRSDGPWRDLDVVDLYLARACADGIAAALAELERRCLRDVVKAVLQLGLGAADCDEVMQSVREQLLVRRRPDDEPYIVRYAGRGSLRAWIRSIAVRTAIRQLRNATRLVPLDEEVFLEFATTIDDPELEPYKQRYRDELRAAFREAVAGLSVRQRNLLRHYFLDSMSIDEVGALYRVHRATAARWIVELREALQAGVRAQVATRIQLSGRELDSLLGLVRSQLELSLERLLP